MPTPKPRPRRLVPALRVLPVLLLAVAAAGCAEDMTTAYSIETIQDPQSGEDHLVYSTQCGAVDETSSFTVVFTVSGLLNGQPSTLPTDQQYVSVMLETSDGPPFVASDPENDILKLGVPGERPLEVGGFGAGTRTDPDGTVWNTWQGAVHPVHLGLLVGSDYADGRYEDVEFTLADAKVRGLADFLRRIKAQ